MKNTRASQQTKIRPPWLFISIGCALCILLGAAAAFIFTRDDDIADTLSHYPLLNPAVIVAEHQDAFVNFQPLRESLQSAYTERDDYLVSLYFEYLPTGSHISVNRDARMWPASLIKIPVAMAAMKKVERGDWKFGNELVILDEDKDSEFGDLYREPTGTTVTIERLFEEALVRSDNTAHFVFLRNLDGSELEHVFSHLGLDEVLEVLKRTPKGEEADNRMTARSYSIFFRSLYNATYLSPEFSQKFLQFLLDSSREYLGRGLPEDVPFAHKTGIRSDDRVWVNSGIVYAPRRPYLLTVMIQEKPGARPDISPETLFKAISKEVYDYVSNLR